MNRAALDAAFRLATQLPTHTHHRDYPAHRAGGARYDKCEVLPQELVDAFKEERKTRASGKLIRSRLHIGTKTYKRLLNLIEGNKK